MIQPIINTILNLLNPKEICWLMKSESSRWWGVCEGGFWMKGIKSGIQNVLLSVTQLSTVSSAFLGRLSLCHGTKDGHFRTTILHRNQLLWREQLFPCNPSRSPEDAEWPVLNHSCTSAKSLEQGKVTQARAESETPSLTLQQVWISSQPHVTLKN